MMYIYADNAATTEMSPAAKRRMTEVINESWGNPSSLHSNGQAAKEVLEQARETVASCIGAKPGEIYFTSGGSEADNQAIISAAEAGAKKGKMHLISTKFEHHAVLHTLERLKKQGFSVTLLDVHEDGMVRPEEVAAAISPDTALVSVMYANNEIGTVQPIREIGAICREKGVLFHTDAVQAVGHIPVNAAEDAVDYLSVSGHKFHGPKGIGFLYARRGAPLRSLIDGGAQERGKRAGTENVPAAAAMATALSEAVGSMERDMKTVSDMRDQLIRAFSAVPHARLNGDPVHRLPGTVNFCFEGIEGESLILYLDDLGIASSSGSACTSGSLDPSHVLLSLGLPHEVAHGSLRLSIDAYNTPEEISYICNAVPQVVARLREMSPVWEELENGTRKHLI